MLKLVLLSPGMTGRTQELKQEKTTIGRLEDNTLQIAEPSVSSHHCEVLLRGSTVVVRDLNSTNGTYVNDQRVNRAELENRTEFEIGTTTLMLIRSVARESPSAG